MSPGESSENSFELPDSPVEAAVDRMDDGVLAFDAASQCTFANDAAMNILRCEDPGDALGRSATELFPESWFGEAEGIDALGSGGNKEFERNDRDRDVTIGVTVLDDESGATVLLQKRSTESDRSSDLMRFRAAIDRSNDAIFLIDVSNLEIVDVNETASRRLGYERGEIVGMDPREIETEMDEADEWESHFETVLEEGAVTYEGLHERRDGSTFPVEVEVSGAVLDESKEYAVAVARDVSDRRERERTLHRFKRAVEAAGHAIYMTDVDATIEYANPAFERVTGYSAEEAVGRNPRILKSGAAGESYYEELWETILAGETWHEEVKNRRKSGEPYWADQIISPSIDEGDAEAFVAIQRDVTERKERERDLELLRRLVDAANDAVYVIDHETGSFEYANDTASEMLGYDPDELLELTVADVDEDFETTDEYLEHVQSAEPGSGFTMTGTHRRADGVKIPVDISAKSVEINEQYYRIATVRDVTEKRSRLRTLEEYRTSLERVNEATTELITADSRDLVRGRLIDLTEDLFGDVTVDYLCFFSDENALRSDDECLLELENAFPDAVVGPEDHEIWSSFVDSSVRELRDVSRPWLGDDSTKTAVVIPAGDDGILLAVCDGDTGISERSSGVATLISTIGRNAFERIEWAERIRRQKEELELTNARLSELTRVNEFVRKLQNELSQSTSREEIERVVCDRLETMEDVELVWIGEYRPGIGKVEPRAWSGSNDTYLDTRDFQVETDATEPAVRAITERSPVVEDSIAADRSRDDWHRDALKRGFGSALSVPIRHDNVMYGTLTLFENSPMSFVEQREMVFTELGETIAHAITMVEQRRSLGSDDKVVLEFETEEVVSVIAALAREIDARVTIDGIVENDTASYYLYGEVENADTSTLSAAASELSNLSNVRVLDEADDTLNIELAVEQQIPPVTILEAGGKFHKCRATPESCRLRVSFDSEAQINTIVETFTDRHPEWELRVRTTDNDLGGSEHAIDSGGTLTNRQREVLRAALHAGYFAWPRETSGEQLADIFDVTPPTVYRHLRLGLQELVSNSLTE